MVRGSAARERSSTRTLLIYNDIILLFYNLKITYRGGRLLAAPRATGARGSIHMYNSRNIGKKKSTYNITAYAITGTRGRGQLQSGFLVVRTLSVPGAEPRLNLDQRVRSALPAGQHGDGFQQQLRWTVCQRPRLLHTDGVADGDRWRVRRHRLGAASRRRCGRGRLT